MSNVRCVKNRNLVKCSHQTSANTLIVCLLALSHKYKKHKNCTKQKYVFTSNKCRLCCCYAYSVSHTDWSHEPPSFLLIAYLTCLTRRNIMVFRRHHRCVQIFLRQLKLSSTLAKTVQMHEIRIHILTHPMGSLQSLSKQSVHFASYKYENGVYLHLLNQSFF